MIVTRSDIESFKLSTYSATTNQTTYRTADKDMRE